MDAKLTTRVICTNRVVATTTLRNMTHEGILERAWQTTLAVARQYDQDPDALKTEVKILDQPAHPSAVTSWALDLVTTSQAA